MLNRLFGRKTKQKSTVWGIRTPPKVKERWCSLSDLMQVPTNRLILYILRDWTEQNAALLLDEQMRSALAARIDDAFLKNELV
jgi:hypothetical protein